MTNEEIFALMARFEQSTCATFKLTMKDFSLELGKAAASAPNPAPVAVPVAAAAPAPEKPEGLFVTAPLVGTYYASAAPDQPPFVKAGDKVKKGQTVCLMEAMKMMSEVPAPCDLVVEELLRSDGELVAFGDAILRYRAV
ncbi:acetyl-CoA carboxylase biotin carboxyl carrier protein subunit [Pseudoflavonifractor phocaeensis]|uniref:acetyl-CoA carboxylase biotin carboxyl carrier protein n=1 Tax=Pseudoflavonifractor phocaeensis TaxID=1870988 RepID=UPI00313A7BE2